MAIQYTVLLEVIVLTSHHQDVYFRTCTIKHVVAYDLDPLSLHLHLRLDLASLEHFQSAALEY